MARVDALPDDLKIPPADDRLLAQGDSQHVPELDVGFVDLGTERREGSLGNGRRTAGVEKKDGNAPVS